MTAPVSRHPPATRLARPSRVYVTPSTEDSKTTQDNSGVTPPRSHVTARVPRRADTCSVGVPSTSLARPARGAPAIVVNVPYVSNLPSAWMASPRMLESGVGANVESTVPSGSRRARYVREIRPRTPSANQREEPGYDDGPVLLQCHRRDLEVGARVVHGVDRAVAQQASDVVPVVHARSAAAELAEQTRDQDLPVRLDHDAIHDGIRPGIERRVE